MIPADDVHLSRLRPVTRDDGCVLYQSRDGSPPAASWLPGEAEPDPREWRVLYAGEWARQVGGDQ